KRLLLTRLLGRQGARIRQSDSLENVLGARQPFVRRRGLLIHLLFGNLNLLNGPRENPSSLNHRLINLFVKISVLGFSRFLIFLLVIHNCISPPFCWKRVSKYFLTFSFARFLVCRILAFETL